MNRISSPLPTLAVLGVVALVGGLLASTSPASPAPSNPPLMQVQEILLPETPAELEFYETTRQSLIVSNPYLTNYGYLLNSSPVAMQEQLSVQLAMFRDAVRNVEQFNLPAGR